MYHALSLTASSKLFRGAAVICTMYVLDIPMRFFDLDHVTIMVPSLHLTILKAQLRL